MRLLPLFLLLLWSDQAGAQFPAALKGDFYGALSAGQKEARQGAAIAMEGNLAVVGAPRQDGRFEDSGVVRIYDTSTGLVVRTLESPNQTRSEFFGTAVAISGSRIVVGATGFGHHPTLNEGGIYIFDLASANADQPVLILRNPTPASDEGFGSRVAISGDIVAVGARGDGAAGAGAGTVYLYHLAGEAPSQPVWSSHGPSPAMGNGFGGSLALDGLRLVVGSPGDSTVGSYAGSVHVYEIGGDLVPVRTATFFNPAPTQFKPFGAAVGISGTRVVVGSAGSDSISSNRGTAYAFDLAAPSPADSAVELENPAAAGYAAFGTAVGISGTRVVVGNHLENTGALDSGCIHLYDLSGPLPAVPVTSRYNPAPAKDDHFGIAVAISGGVAIASATGDDSRATNAGAVYAYDAAAVIPAAPVATLDEPGPSTGDAFGFAVALAGNRLVSGAPNDRATGESDGRVYVNDLDAPGAPGLAIDHPFPGTGGHFGRAVAADGGMVVVGAPYDHIAPNYSGRAFVFNLDSPTPAVPVAILENPAGADGDWFGWAVAIDGSRVVVGAPYNAGSAPAGRAYVYEMTSPSPGTPVRILDNPSPDHGDEFGASVALKGAKVVVGCRYDDTGATNSGAAYLYDLDSASPATPVLSLFNPTPGSADYFGSAVGISGSTVAIGAPGDDAGASDAGAVYLYHSGNGLPFLTLPGPGLSANADFGAALALSGARIIVGSPGHGGDAGRCHTFDLGNLSPADPEFEVHAFPLPRDSFGSSVAISGTMVAAGAHGSDDRALDRGAAYVRELIYHGDPAFNEWLHESGLGGWDAYQEEDPFGDGVANVLKYAFNLDVNRPDNRRLEPGEGTVGLPVFRLTGPSGQRTFRVEFLRRRNSGILYTPKFGTDFETWFAMPGEPVVTSIDAEWERAVMEMPVDPVSMPRLFGVVDVSVPWPSP
jgi:hypothetical protein